MTVKRERQPARIREVAKRAAQTSGTALLKIDNLAHAYCPGSHVRSVAGCSVAHIPDTSSVDCPTDAS